VLHIYIVFDTLSTLIPRAEFRGLDAIVKKYNVNDKAIGRLALIVRGADTPRRDLTPESPGLEAIAEGFKRLAAAQGYDDHETIRRERHLYDALYLYCGGDANKLRRD